ncbi:MAG: hypothetical protein KGD63_01245 [Candidatus Lokiarchaeota archaeon]|nr:hypothetical protein [Candidatus Lokiarchaeota archaeon]
MENNKNINHIDGKGKDCNTFKDFKNNENPIMDETSERSQDLKFGEEIALMVDNAGKMAYRYEISLKKGSFEQKCPYLEIIDIYKEIIRKLLEKGWISQLETYSKEIDIYKKKYEKDKNLREIELQKESKQKAFEQSQKIKEVDSVQAVLQSLETEMRVLNFEAKKQEKWMEFDNILGLIDRAEKLVKDYKLKIKKENILEIESPYHEILKVYEDAKNKFKEFGWNDAAKKLFDSIEFYKKEFINDNNLRECEKKKV